MKPTHNNLLSKARDPWAHEFVRGLELLFMPYAPPNGLLEPVFKVLLGLAASYIAERLEVCTYPPLNFIVKNFMHSPLLCLMGVVLLGTL